jgi:CRISPR-associated protein (TIGR02710 family)
MEKILVVTVGGSPQPIENSISHNLPSYIVFLCSDDDPYASTKGSYTMVEKHDGFVSKFNLSKKQYEIQKLTDVDDLESIHNSCSEIIEKITKENPQSTILVDYSGGTKSMSAGLVIAALHFPNVQFTLVKGQRADLEKIKNLTEFSTSIRVGSIRFKDQIFLIGNFIKNYEYDSALKIINTITTSNYSLSNEEHRLLSLYNSACKAFYFWDKFNHQSAFDLLKGIRKHFVKEVVFLEAIIKSLLAFELREKNEKISNYEIVFDLIENAERKATKKLFDDALARIYRALELFIQIYLVHEHNLHTSSIPMEVIPDVMKERVFIEGNMAKLGLFDSFELCGHLKDTMIYASYNENKKRLLSALTKRNTSILAHGIRPITEKDYSDCKFVIEFIKEMISKTEKNETRACEFPGTFIFKEKK